jgi:hypothetical protein
VDTLAVTVLIRMTGLLLLTPSNTSGRLPVHVLMPATGNLSAHVAQVGFRGANTRWCAFWDDGICYVNMEGWSLDIRRPVGPTSGTTHMPKGAANVSSTVGRRVRSQHLGQTPGRMVRSRISLYSGSVSATCAIASWRWTSTSTRDTLANVLDWTISNWGRKYLVLTRQPLDPQPHESAEIIDTLYADPVTNTIELFIRHVPAAEQDHDYVSNLPPQQDTHTSGSQRNHFHGYYDLLGVRHDGVRPVPSDPRRLIENGQEKRWCPWATVAGPERLVIIDVKNAGTMSCMVAAGNPP